MSLSEGALVRGCSLVELVKGSLSELVRVSLPELVVGCGPFDKLKVRLGLKVRGGL